MLINHSIKLSRRSLLGAAGGVALASGVPRSIAAAEKADVIVIGAGFAGLNAATVLAENGAKVEVLEASGRIGGRAFTADHIEGRPELGANQVAPFYARIIDMADRLGVKLIKGSNMNAPFAFSVGGQLVSAEDWEESPLNKTVGIERTFAPSALNAYYIWNFNPLTEMDSWLEGGAVQYDMSLGAWLESVGASSEAIRLINANSIGEDVWRVSALRYLQDGARSKFLFENMKNSPTGSGYEAGAPLTYRIEGGTARLPEAMANALEHEVKLNKVVTRIDMNKSGVEVSCLDGTKYAAKHVISAVPFTAFRNIEVTPRLEGNQFRAVYSLPYRNNSQVYLSISGGSFWDQDGLQPSLWSDGELDMARVPMSPEGELEDRLSVIVAGRSADRIDQFAPEDRGEFVIREIERIRPSTKGKLKVTGIHSWRNSPFNLGCSHSFDAGTVGDFAQSMIQPHHRLHIAGEHTRRLEVGMEAAMESGERAAFEVLEASG